MIANWNAASNCVPRVRGRGTASAAFGIAMLFRFQNELSLEKLMNRRERSLRVLVEKWLGTEGAKCARVTRFNHSAQKKWRYVCVETQRPSGTFAIVFFRHDDGSWCVFPPSIRHPVMAIARTPALPVSDRYDVPLTAVDAFA